MFAFFSATKEYASFVNVPKFQTRIGKEISSKQVLNFIKFESELHFV
jgi:hypothetical protein